jgi:hypothetical protein
VLPHRDHVLTTITAMPAGRISARNSKPPRSRPPFAPMPSASSPSSPRPRPAFMASPPPR